MNPRLPSMAEIPPEFYVVRDADRQLANVIDQMGRPPYVLDPRQMGKTNLLLNARRTLETDLLRFVYVDLSFRPATLRQFYARVIEIAGQAHPDVFDRAAVDRALAGADAENDFATTTAAEDFLRRALAGWPGRLVIVLDEIDALTNKSFSDRVFAHIRSFYFVRRDNPEFHRLTFVLSGVAEPTQLIRDKSISPFNIGQKIFLTDFTAAQFDELLGRAGLGFADGIRRRVLYWTSGNPRLTWDVTADLDLLEAGGGTLDEAVVDETVRRMFLTSFDRAPVDHVRALVEADPTLRRSVLRLRAGEDLGSRERTALHLAGIATLEPEGRPTRFRSRIVEHSLSERWLAELGGAATERLIRARAAYEARDFRAAADGYAAFFTAEPVSDSVLADVLRYSTSLRHVGDVAGALHWLELLAARRPDGPDPAQLMRMAAYALEIDRKSEARDHLRRALAGAGDDPTRSLVGGMLAGVLVGSPEDADEARALAEAIVARHPSPRDVPADLRNAVATALQVLARLTSDGELRRTTWLRALPLLDGTARLACLTDLVRQGPSEAFASELLAALERREAATTPDERGIVIEAFSTLAGRTEGDGLLRAVDATADMLGMTPVQLLAFAMRRSGSWSQQEFRSFGDAALAVVPAGPDDLLALRLVLAAVITRLGTDGTSAVSRRYLDLLERSASTLTREDHFAILLLMREPDRIARTEHADALFEAVRSLEPQADPALRESFALVRYVQVYGALRRRQHEEAVALARDGLLLLDEARGSGTTLPNGVADAIRASLSSLPEVAPAMPVKNRLRGVGRNDIVTVVYRDGERRTAKYKHVRQDLDLGTCRLIDEEERETA